jgi:predicted transcriptional regulator
MYLVDERIIEYLDAKGWGSAEILQQELKMTTSTERIEARCERLSEAGLIAPLYEGAEQYELTTLGERYLDESVYVEGLLPEERAL